MSFLIPVFSLPPGTYTKNQILEKLGYISIDPVTGNITSLKKAYATVDQKEYDDGKDSYMERVYIWNSTFFKIDDDTKFVIDQQGKKEVQDLFLGI